MENELNDAMSLLSLQSAQVEALIDVLLIAYRCPHEESLINCYSCDESGCSEERIRKCWRMWSRDKAELAMLQKD